MRTRCTQRCDASRDGVPAGRALHLLDIENLCGDPFAPDELVSATTAEYCAAARYHLGDHMVVAANAPDVVFAADRYLPYAQLIRTRGPDGADNALIGWADPAFIAARYDRLVIGSGDHLFSGIAGAAQRLGVLVHVVSRPGQLAGCLGRAARVVHLLEPLPRVGAAA